MGAYAVLGVLAFAVAALAVYTLTTNTIKDRRVQFAQVERETADVQAKARALQHFADFKTVAEQRVATVRSLADSRFDWEQALRDLSRALPADVHLRTLNGTTGTQVTGGSSTNPLRGAVQAPAVELSGCTTSQAAVARLLSRLRNVRGVTRVTLAKSDKDNGNVGVTAATTADGKIPASLCPKGAPPAFEVVVFFERAAVPANAAPNVGAAAPASSAAPAASESNGSSTPPADGGSNQSPNAGGSNSASGSTTQGVSAR
ncbi:MAG TPA: PilN domain-containing protein [Solirubrobacteraceae bacterium]|nr:PilN domain-containing protein [Solirubrobacteraceae bacterium]